jgi:glycosyltransferase involved in cell wall biosynthesis
MHSKISVIIPCYNSEKTICKTLDSIEKQELDNSLLLEILVVDNASTDNTKNLIQNYKSQKYKIHYLYESVKNRSKARNTGTLYSQNEYLIFVDSDTELEENWIQEMYSKINSSPYYGGGEGHIESKILFRDNYIEKIRKIIKTDSNVMLGNIGKKFPMINTAACIYRKSALLDAGLFDEKLNYLEDIDLSRSVFYSGYTLFATEKARSFCYNDSPTFFSFLKRNFISGKEFYKYSKKWSSFYPELNTAGYLTAIASNILTNINKELLQNHNIIVSFVRTIFYLSSGLGYIFSLFVNRNFQKKDCKPRAQLISDGDHFGVVELDQRYILQKFNDNSYKSFIKAFPIDILYKKYNADILVHGLHFIESIAQDYISIYLVGSHSKHTQSIYSRKDIDLVIFVKSTKEAAKLSSKIKSLKPVLSQKLDIVVFTPSIMDDCNIFHNQGIKASEYAMHHATLLAGKKLERSKPKHITNTDGFQLYYLYFKKICYYLITKKQNFVGHMLENSVDFIDLYKLISYQDITLKEEYCTNSDELYQENLKKFDNNEVDLLEVLADKDFILSRTEFKKNEKIIKEITFKSIKLFLKNFNEYINTIHSHLDSFKCPKEFFDYNFLNIDANIPIQANEYPALMFEKTKLYYEELIERLRC